MAVIVPELRKNGMHYEVNINGFPRFVMAWSALGRFDIIADQPDIPYDLLLGVSDILEGMKRKK